MRLSHLIPLLALWTACGPEASVGPRRVEPLVPIERPAPPAPGAAQAADPDTGPGTGTGSERAPPAGAFTPLEVVGDHRAARRLGPLDLKQARWSQEVRVPLDVDSLLFDVALDPEREREQPSAPGWQLELLFTERGDSTSRRSLGRWPIPEQDGRWHRARLDARPLAGQAGQLVFRALPPDAGDDVPAPSLLLGLPLWTSTAGTRRPNVIVVSLDTTRPDHLGCYGYARDTTPHLDALAGRSVLFRRATSTSAYTLPSHASLFSGQYPTTHGAEHRTQAVDAGRTPLLAALLQDEGYLTRAFTGGGYLDADFGFAQGFYEYAENDPLLPYDADGQAELSRSADGRAYVAGRQAQTWESALGWIEAHRELPFFLFLHTFAIHDYRPSAGHRGHFGGPPPGDGAVKPLRNLIEQVLEPYTPDEQRQLVDLYDEALREVDGKLGALFESLERLGLAQDTIVVVTSDHGEDFGEHAVRDSAIVGHGHGLWQTQLDVPLIVHVPWGAAGVVDDRVSLVDITPTLLDVLGLPEHPAMQGRSLVGLMEGGREPALPVLAELHTSRHDMRAYLRDRLKLVTGDPTADVQLPVPTATQLYDIQRDPLEQDDLHVLRPDVARDLTEQHDSLVELLEAQRSGDLVEAQLSEATRRRLVELGYVDG